MSAQQEAHDRDPKSYPPPPGGTAPLNEGVFLHAVLDLAHLRGWESYHPRPARTLDSWRTAGTGTMAKGFPDLLLVHPEQRRLLFMELKTDTGRLTADQERVLSVLRETLTGFEPRYQVQVWKPAMWAAIEETLR